MNLTLREGTKIKAVGNRKVLGPKEEEVTENGENYFTVCTFQQISLRLSVKEDTMGGTRNTHGEMKNTHNIQSKILKGRNHL
jgi:hypothetical protein